MEKGRSATKTTLPPPPPSLSYADVVLPLVERVVQIKRLTDCERGDAHYYLLPDKAASVRVAAIPVRYDVLEQATRRFGPDAILSQMENLRGDTDEERALELEMLGLEARAFAIAVDPEPELRYRAAFLDRAASHPRVHQAAALGRDLRQCDNLRTAVHGDLLGHAIKERATAHLSQADLATWADWTTRGRIQRAESRAQLVHLVDNQLAQTVFDPVESLPSAAGHDAEEEFAADMLQGMRAATTAATATPSSSSSASSSSSPLKGIRLGIREGEPIGIPATDEAQKLLAALFPIEQATTAHREIRPVFAAHHQDWEIARVIKYIVNDKTMLKPRQIARDFIRRDLRVSVTGIGGRGQAVEEANTNLDQLDSFHAWDPVSKEKTEKNPGVDSPWVRATKREKTAIFETLLTDAAWQAPRPMGERANDLPYFARFGAGTRDSKLETWKVWATRMATWNYQSDQAKNGDSNYLDFYDGADLHWRSDAFVGTLDVQQMQSDITRHQRSVAAAIRGGAVVVQNPAARAVAEKELARTLLEWQTAQYSYILARRLTMAGDGVYRAKFRFKMINDLAMDTATAVDSRQVSLSEVHVGFAGFSRSIFELKRRLDLAGVLAYSEGAPLLFNMHDAEERVMYEAFPLHRGMPVINPAHLDLFLFGPTAFDPARPKEGQESRRASSYATMPGEYDEQRLKRAEEVQQMPTTGPEFNSYLWAQLRPRIIRAARPSRWARIVMATRSAPGAFMRAVRDKVGAGITSLLVGKRDPGAVPLPGVDEVSTMLGRSLLFLGHGLVSVASNVDLYLVVAPWIYVSLGFANDARATLSSPEAMLALVVTAGQWLQAAGFAMGFLGAGARVMMPAIPESVATAAAVATRVVHVIMPQATLSPPLQGRLFALPTTRIEYDPVPAVRAALEQRQADLTSSSSLLLARREERRALIGRLGRVLGSNPSMSVYAQEVANLYGSETGPGGQFLGFARPPAPSVLGNRELFYSPGPFPLSSADVQAVFRFVEIQPYAEGVLREVRRLFDVDPRLIDADRYAQLARRVPGVPDTFSRARALYNQLLQPGRHDGSLLPWNDFMTQLTNTTRYTLYNFAGALSHDAHAEWDIIRGLMRMASNLRIDGLGLPVVPSRLLRLVIPTVGQAVPLIGSGMNVTAVAIASDILQEFAQNQSLPFARLVNEATRQSWRPPLSPAASDIAYAIRQAEAQQQQQQQQPLNFFRSFDASQAATMEALVQAISFGHPAFAERPTIRAIHQNMTRDSTLWGLANTADAFSFNFVGRTMAGVYALSAGSIQTLMQRNISDPATPLFADQYDTVEYLAQNSTLSEREALQAMQAPASLFVKKHIHHPPSAQMPTSLMAYNLMTRVPFAGSMIGGAYATVMERVYGLEPGFYAHQESARAAAGAQTLTEIPAYVTGFWQRLVGVQPLIGEANSARGLAYAFQYYYVITWAAVPAAGIVRAVLRLYHFREQQRFQHSASPSLDTLRDKPDTDILTWANVPGRFDAFIRRIHGLDAEGTWTRLFAPVINAYYASRYALSMAATSPGLRAWIPVDTLEYQSLTLMLFMGTYLHLDIAFEHYYARAMSNGRLTNRGSSYFHRLHIRLVRGLQQAMHLLPFMEIPIRLFGTAGPEELARIGFVENILAPLITHGLLGGMARPTRLIVQAILGLYLAPQFPILGVQFTLIPLLQLGHVLYDYLYVIMGVSALMGGLLGVLPLFLGLPVEPSSGLMGLLWQLVSAALKPVLMAVARMVGRMYLTEWRKIKRVFFARFRELTQLLLPFAPPQYFIDSLVPFHRDPNRWLHFTLDYHGYTRVATNLDSIRWDTPTVPLREVARLVMRPEFYEVEAERLNLSPEEARQRTAEDLGGKENASVRQRGRTLLVSAWLAFGENALHRPAPSTASLLPVYRTETKMEEEEDKEGSVAMTTMDGRIIITPRFRAILHALQAWADAALDEWHTGV